MKQLGAVLTTQEGGFKVLFERASNLEVAAKGTRSPTVISAINEILEVVKGFQGSRKELISAFNSATGHMKSYVTRDRAVPPSLCCAATQTGAMDVLEDKRKCATTTDAASNTDAPLPSPPSEKGPRAQEPASQQQQPQPRRRRKKHQQQQHQLRKRPNKEQQQQQQPRVESEQPSQAADHDQQQQPTWSQVARRTKKSKKEDPPPAKKVQPTAAERIALLQRRVPKTAAVTIDRPGDDGSLVAVMRKVSSSINLASLGVSVLTTRKTRAGGILLEVDGIEKASLLADKIRSVIGDTARVRLPEPRTPILLLGIPEWVEVEEVLEGLVRAGIMGIAAGYVRIQRNAGGRGEYVASLTLPLKDAIQLAETKAVVIGWTKCRVKLIEKNQPTCYRCQGKGHLAAECRNDAKPRRCHRCQDEGHLARDCMQLPRRQQTDSARQQNQQKSTVSQEGNTQRLEESPGVQPIEQQ
ncbi:uncharacterized protein LOC113558067 [Rhopalosiphum maidis]|uniref:uncharacterized protein LOC113558067 n=1 Tax=Rhopalosiphum maidis TaxID=43146 RepID=UPI000F0093F7|nr:uncharacterized protein LOC113558067 [Rhopalosiphum maidis]